MEGRVELLNDVFGEPPEATEEAAPGATIYLRVPASLKDRIEEAATDDKLSVNGWALRCVERCTKLDEIGLCLGAIVFTAMALDLEPETGAYSMSDIRCMVEHMREEAVRAARLLGWQGKQIEGLAEATAGTDHYRPFPPSYGEH